MQKYNYLFGPMRLPFLILSPAIIFMVVGFVAFSSNPLNGWYIVLLLIGGVAAHISVNALNEYSDFKTGLDFKTMKTPFSGGSGTLPASPEKAGTALTTGLVAAGVTALIGIFFTFVQGWALIPVGLVGLVVIFTYTVYLNKYPVLCLIAPGLGFGTLMVLGAVFALTDHFYFPGAFIASLIPFFLVNNLLLLNQFPDAEPDKSIGRRHIAIVSGRKFAAMVYSIFLGCAYASIMLGVALGYFPLWALLGLGTLVIAVPTIRNVLQNPDNIEKLIPSQGMNVIITILTPILVGIGFLIG